MTADHYPTPPAVPGAIVAPPAGAPAFYDPDAESPFARRLRLRQVFDNILATVVIALAFLLASTPIRNSDIWMHLATGRQILNHPGEFSAETFAHTAGDASAPRPSWLFDVLVYTVYCAGGGVGLGLVRALVAAALAGAILRAGWTGPGGWVATILAALAILAAAPRLQLQPMLISLLFLALTIAFLERRAAAGSTPAPVTWTTFWPLYGLFILWVNLDGWFILGPGVLACYWIGSRLPPSKSASAVPTAAVLAGLAACVVNPYVFWAFRVPAELDFPGRHPALASDPVFRGLFLAPLQAGYYAPDLAWSAAGLALALLLTAALLAFMLNPAGRHATWLLLTVGLLALGLYQARNLPLLAVALAAVMPRAWRAYADARFANLPGAELRLRQAVIGRFGCIVGGVALLALAWRGGLQPGPPEARCWATEIDPSLEQATRDLAAWRNDGKLAANARGFNYALDVANYCAWFCPQEKGFFDGRLNASFPAAEYVTVRHGLAGQQAIAGAANEDWRAVLRRRHVDHIVIAERERPRLLAVLQQVLGSPQEWPVLFQSGRVLVVAWRDPEAAIPAAWHGVDLNERGMRPVNVIADSAPPQAEPLVPRWYDALSPPTIQPSLDRDEAALDLMMFDAMRLPTLLADARRWELALAAAAMGHGAGDVPAGPLAAAVRVGWLIAARVTPPERADRAPVELSALTRYTFDLQRSFMQGREVAPPGFLWAAIRAGRRALGTDPTDAEASLLLGEAYVALVRDSAERAWGRRLPQLTQLHRLLAVDALQRALALNPRLDQAHGYLVNLYESLNYTDLAARHLRVFLKIQRERGALPGEPPERYQQRLADAQKAVDQMDQRIASREEFYEKKQEGLSIADRARLLENLGLAERALALLLDSDVAAFGNAGMALEMDLLLASGRADEARRWLEPKHEEFLGSAVYQWLAARLAAIAGDYTETDAHLQSLQADTVVVHELGTVPIDLESALAVSVAGNVLDGARQALVPALAVRLEAAFAERARRLQSLSLDIRRSAAIATLRGVMDVERGDSDRALRQFRRAQALTHHETGALAPMLAERSVYPIAGHFLELLRAPPRPMP